MSNIFWNRIAEATGAKCHGYGIGGTRIAPECQKGQETEDKLYFGARVKDMISDADVVVVFGGTNDFGHGEIFFGDLRGEQKHSFCGAFHQLLIDLLTRYPAAQIVVMTPLHRTTEDDLGVNEHGTRREHRLEDYVDAIIHISGYYGVPVLDLFRVSGMQPAVPVIMEKYMPDGLHPNDEGHAIIAEKLIGFLKLLG